MLTQARLKELMHYDPATGIFTWLQTRGCINAGSVACARSDDGAGYKRSRIDGKLYRHHRLAWLYVHGHLPEEQIDHIDHCRGNNAIGNLRLATTSENNQNQIVARGTNKELLGVYKRKDTGRFSASIRLDGKSHSLGCFDTAVEAHAAYLEAKKQMHPFQTLVA